MVGLLTKAKVKYSNKMVLYYCRYFLCIHSFTHIYIYDIERVLSSVLLQSLRERDGAIGGAEIRSLASWFAVLIGPLYLFYFMSLMEQLMRVTNAEMLMQV